MPLEVTITQSDTGAVSVRVSDQVPIATVLGLIEVAKVVLSKPLLAPPRQVVPASAAALDALPKNGVEARQ